MTKEEIIHIARNAGAIPIHKRPKEFAVVGNENIERFFQASYAKGQADEREALRERLEQPVQQQQEPVVRCMEHGECFGGECIYTSPPQPAQPAQQGVDEFDVGWNAARRFYTSPPASKPWVGLTTADLDEIDAPIRERGSATIAEIYRAIEAKLKEKNK